MARKSHLKASRGIQLREMEAEERVRVRGFIIPPWDTETAGWKEGCLESKSKASVRLREKLIRQ